MGRSVRELVSRYENIHIVAQIDKTGRFGIENIKDIKNADCAIDFSSHLISDRICASCVECSLPLVMGTTGHTEKEIMCIEEAAKKIPIFFSENMAFCMLLMKSFIRQCAEKLSDFDALITETHRKGKADSPSKTALKLKNEIKLCSGGFIDSDIFSVRKDNCAGKHEVVFFGEDEEIVLTHTCFDRTAYAKGALKAAEFIINKKNGIYSSDSFLL